MMHIVRYWLPSGKLFKEPFNTAEAAIERYLTLLAAGHKNLKLYTQSRADLHFYDQLEVRDVGPDGEL